jgi:NADH:ubiquinone oxidoreductase subunit F (NADH-binding)/(2Fe-2S) ferredoxin/Pyruvate/2-oxoacid:ferredoxin oxidoreductase delta subunit
VSLENRIGSLKELEEVRGVLVDRSDPDRPVITICTGTGCVASGAETVAESFRKAVEELQLGEKVEVKGTGCHGFCEMGPLVTIRPSGYFYPKVKTGDVHKIIERTVLNGEPIEELLYTDPMSEQRIEKEEEVPFYKHQHRIVLAENGFLDPTDLEDYLQIGGYKALAYTLEWMSPDGVIGFITDSGLRGRGGAGFLTGQKWAVCRSQPKEPKYIVCNADEGDPGAYMDRSILEGNPHRVVEGMCIGAFAIGASQGFVYVRHEYPLAVKRITKAIEDARRAGFLGENILGTGFSFDLKIVRGAGAFVCGEETALIASLEGRKGEPRQRPPFPAESGYRNRPTIINNVETWANVPHIINNGPEWYASMGSEKSKGSKIFSLVGKVNNTGLVEVPMGMSVRQVIFDIGGGIPKGKAFKAVQTGGPAGGCLPAGLLDLPIDFEALTSAGTIMGSGGLIVMDESTCMVDIARYFTKFLEEESCGKCYSCRKGTQRMREILDDICEGRGTMEQLDLLEELGQTVNLASMCGFGQNAGNPVLSTLRYFREEYEAHIKEHRCPAGVCSALIRYEITEALCDGCAACAKLCPSDAISGEKNHLHIINDELCVKCGTCLDVCAKDAVIVVSGGGEEA